MIPVYGFLEGDVIGLLILMRSEQTVGDFIERLQQSASVRVPPRNELVALHEARTLDPRWTIAEARLLPLDRVDVFRSPR